MGELKRRGRIWWIRYYRDGRRYEESSRSAKETIARRLLRLREGDIERGLPVSPKVGQLRFEEAAQDLLNDYQVNGKRTLKDVERRLRLHLRPVFGRRRMATITTSDVRVFSATRLSAGASHAEINRELAVLKRAYRLAVEADKYHGRVPKIPLLQERNVRQGFFDDAMVEGVLEELPAHLRPIVRFAYVTGWRVRSEVLPLEWRQVDRQKGEVRLDPGTTKNQAGRVFPFTDSLQALFDALWAEHEALRLRGALCRHVFQRNGKAIGSFRKAWASACRAAGYPSMLVHDLRRSAVGNMERAGLSRSVAMQLTGHKTEAVYRRYAITSEADLREGVDRLNGRRGDNRLRANSPPSLQSA